MPVAIRNVAREAGVSIETVSRVVNNLGEITEETRQGVCTVIEELGCRLNVVTCRFVSDRTPSVATIVLSCYQP